LPRAASASDIFGDGGPGFFISPSVGRCAHIRVDIGGGQIMTSSITNEAVDDLGIKAKGHVIVVIKASDVMIAVD
jgi:molybdopterin-binding protein